MEASAKPKKKVLIIDDSVTIRRQVTSALTGAGFDVLEAADGVDGADCIRGRADLALVLCDVNMPRLNGLEMLESVGEEIAAKSLPVVMLTTEGEPQAILRAKKAGARAWIVKPFKEHLLVSAVKKLTQPGT
jgi:two-component system, chemotaxis family, chemotaxis protein CheY